MVRQHEIESTLAGVDYDGAGRVGPVVGYRLPRNRRDERAAIVGRGRREGCEQRIGGESRRRRGEYKASDQASLQIDDTAHDLLLETPLRPPNRGDRARHIWIRFNKETGYARNRSPTISPRRSTDWSKMWPKRHSRAFLPA